jgi:hypothetical protein
MRSVPDDRPDLMRPALIVTYGTTSRKYRALEREVVVVGRAPGCDVSLASPEVAPVHCVLARGPHGWRVRDCSGRGATRVNGSAVVEGPLHHGDTLQIGAFSFEAHLPGDHDGVETAAAPQPVPRAAMDNVPVAVAVDMSSLLDNRARELAQQAEQLRRQEEEMNARLTRRHEELAKTEATIRDQRAEVVRRMSELARAGQSSKPKAEGADRKDGEALRSQLAMVKQDLAGRDSIIAGLRVRLEKLEREIAACKSTEAEREQIAKERVELDERAAQLEERRADLAEATREAELMAARERAKLARDRHELERLLDDFRYEQEQARKQPEALEPAVEPQRLTVALPSRSGLRTIVRNSGSHPGAKLMEFGASAGSDD